MPDSMPRVALALAAIVAIVVISVAVKDYVQHEKQAKPATTVSTTTVADAKAKSRSNKSSSKRNSAKTRAQLSMSTAKASAQAAEGVEKQPINGDFAGTDAATMAMKDADPSVSQTQLADDPIQTSDGQNRLRNQLDRLGSRGSSTCLPLPNGTTFGDVDAAYYDNWAGEYCDR
jgi:hypothetical protein